MATTAADFNWAGTAIPGGDFPCINTSGSTIAVGSCVLVDATNSLTTTAFTGFSGGMPSPGALLGTLNAYPMGVAIENATAGAQFRVRHYGIAVCFATAAVITAGDKVSLGASGAVFTKSGVNPTIGQALNTTSGTANDPVLVMIDIANNA